MLRPDQSSGQNVSSVNVGAVFGERHNPNAQVSLMRDDDSATILPQISIEVADVDEVHSRAVLRGLNIVYPLRNEPWGVRRFFVTDPNGTVINVLCHIGGAQ
jgi:uncharacterized glyoxalase superfamily protein PhnB